MSPIYARWAKGARFGDADGREFIDWVSGIGAVILGYCDDVVDQAVCDQLRQGTIYSVNHELEVELAEELVELIPCAEMVRYAKGGGEACAVAVRIARGVTGRDKILFCGYHGWHDWYLAANLAPGALDDHLLPGIDPIGVPAALRDTALPFPYGDPAELEAQLERHRGEVAAVMMEPLRSQWPPEGYLEAVRELCDRERVLLIFDEVSTGFRLSAGGVQPVLGVTPDLAVFAKSISNGFPMGAVVGRRDVMAPAASMFISSTYWSDTIGLRAALTTLRELRRRDVPATLKATGQTLKERIRQAASATHCPVRVSGLDVHPQLEFELEPAWRNLAATLYIQEMALRGCHGYPSFYLNAAQGDPEIEQTAAAAKETFALIAAAVEDGEAGLRARLRCPPRGDAFRRQVR
ncbi:MAG: aminotransferase class III-fold pyridoxal phosphate-dependent enzyme [Planctomycetales bacterium]|nr:aminotransferase class III-fold pyridoxal phosphate-dependent enzyme [Planctomycetales bacterium]